MLLVVEGGYDTLSIVRDEVCGDNPIPTVLVKESGGTADLLVYAMNNKIGIELQNKNISKIRHKGLEEQICETFKFDDEEKIQEAYDYITELLDWADMVSYCLHLYC